MTSHDVSKLSYSELLNLSKELDQQIAAKRAEELKVLADGYLKKMEAAGFTVVEAVQALQPYLGNKSTGKKRGPSTAAVLYRDPSDPSNTWSGRGRAAKWLAPTRRRAAPETSFACRTSRLLAVGSPRPRACR